MGNKSNKPIPAKNKVELRPEINRFNILHNKLHKLSIDLIRIINEYAEDIYASYNPECSMTWRQFKESNIITSSLASRRITLLSN